VSKLLSLWPDRINPFVVLTGGEPLLQVDLTLVKELKRNNFKIAIETNGTILAPRGIDWICVSPKIGNKLVQDFGDELKLVFPQKGVNPIDFEKFSFKNFSLQPKDGRFIKQNTKLTINYCMKNPKWNLSIQTHKILGID